MTEGDFSPLTLLHQRWALERIGVDSSGRLFRLPGDNPDDIYRVMAVRLDDGPYVAYFRDDLSGSAVAQLQALAPEQIYHDHALVLGLLGASELPGLDHVYFFSESPKPEEYPLVVNVEASL